MFSRQSDVGLWRAPTIRIMTAGLPNANGDGSKGGGPIDLYHWILLFILPHLCSVYPLWLKFNSTMLSCYRRAPIHPARPLYKLPLHVNSCFPNARQTVQSVCCPSISHMEETAPFPSSSPLHLHPFSLSLSPLSVSGQSNNV